MSPIARCRAGATSVEYAVIASLVVATLTAATGNVGQSISVAFDSLAEAVNGPADTPGRAQMNDQPPPPKDSPPGGKVKPSPGSPPKGG